MSESSLLTVRKFESIILGFSNLLLARLVVELVELLKRVGRSKIDWSSTLVDGVLLIEPFVGKHRFESIIDLDLLFISW